MAKRYFVAASTGLVAVVLFAGLSLTRAADEKDPLEGVKCLVSGKPAVAEQTAEYKEGKVYFCCPGCPAPFKKDTAKFATKANHQLVQTGQYEAAKCPLTGRPLNDKQTVEVAGVNVAFCCGNCKGKVAGAEPEEQLELVFADKAFDKGFKKAEEKK